MKISTLLAVAAACCAISLTAQDAPGMGGVMMPPPNDGPPPGMMPNDEGGFGGGLPPWASMPPPGLSGTAEKITAETSFSGIESATPEQWRTLREYLRQKYPDEFAAFEKMRAGSPRSAIAGYRALALRDKLQLTSPRGLSAPDDNKTICKRDISARIKAAEAAVAAKFPAEYAQLTELRKTDRAAARIMFAALYKKLTPPVNDQDSTEKENSGLSATAPDAAAGKSNAPNRDNAAGNVKNEEEKP